MSAMFHSLFLRSALGLALVGTLAWVVGCRSEEPQSSASSTPAAPSANHTPGEATAAADVPEGLAELSPADRELAIQQQVCPVSGQKLGSMGPPIKVTVAGHEVFICCEGCRQQLEDEPAKYLAELGLEPPAM